MKPWNTKTKQRTNLDKAPPPSAITERLFHKARICRRAKKAKQEPSRSYNTICLFTSAEYSSRDVHVLMSVVPCDKNQVRFRRQSCGFFLDAVQSKVAFEAFLVPNSLPLRRVDLNGPNFNPVPALVAKLLTVWVRTSERGHTMIKQCAHTQMPLTKQCAHTHNH